MWLPNKRSPVKMTQMSIAAVLVNHNTSAFAELAVRSLFVQNPGLDLQLTVYDNGSTDDRAGLLAAADDHGVRVVPSGFSTSTPGNSHGEVLRSFVLDPGNEEADQFLFLDADICFTRPGTIARLLALLSEHSEVFGAGPRMSWDGETPLPAEVTNNPALYLNRLHPCCALISNTPVFRSVVEHVGLSCARMLYATHDDFLDTFELMTRVMRTHALRHVIADDTMIMHAFAVSYPDESSAMLAEKEKRRDHWLAVMRDRDCSTG